MTDDMTNTTPLQPKWQLKQHMNCGKKHHSAYRDDVMGVQHESCTAYPHGIERGPGKSQSWYFIDGDDTEYTSQSEMMAAYEKRKKVAKG